MGTPGWAIAGIFVLVLVVILNYLREEAADERARTAARAAELEPAAEPDPSNRCAVQTCTRPATRARHGWRLCDDDYDAYVHAPKPRALA